MNEDRPEIAICIISNEENLYLTRYTITNLLSKTNVPVSLYMYNVTSKDQMPELSDLHAYFSMLSSNNRHNRYRYINGPASSETECKRDFINQVKILSESHKIRPHYICFFPVGILVGKNWAEDLVFNFDHCISCGILSISTRKENLRLSSAMYDSFKYSEPNIKPIWVDESNFVSGLMFTSILNIDKIGDFGFQKESGMSAFDDFEMSFHSQSHGLKNFFILKQSALHYNMLPLQAEAPPPKRQIIDKFKQYIEQTVKNKYGNGSQHTDTSASHS